MGIKRTHVHFAASAHKPKAATYAYVFSTLLKCGICGSSYTMNGKTHYGCASRSNGRKRFCTNTLTVKRSTVESVFLADIRKRTLAPAVIAEMMRHSPKWHAAAAQAPKVDDSRVGSLRAEITNLTDAIASGVTTILPCPRRAPAARGSRARAPRREGDGTVRKGRANAAADRGTTARDDS